MNISKIKLVLMHALTLFVICSASIYSNDISDDFSNGLDQPLDEAEAYRIKMTLEGHPEYIEEQRERFNEVRRKSLMDESESELVAKPLAFDYLFRREGYCYTCNQDINVSDQVINLLIEKKLSKVDFDKTKVYPFEGGGTCTAMAMDFLARYVNECSNMTSRSAVRAKVKQFAPFYTYGLSTDISRQAAYNTIRVDRQAHINNPDEMKYRKMQSMANYHSMNLEPATSTIKRSKISQKPKSFKSKIKNLPNGYYIVRGLEPADNEKMEYFGHTMIFIKTPHISLYFDNGDGAVDITSDPAGYVKDKLLGWGFKEFRLYKVTCVNNSCKNVATE